MTDVLIFDILLTSGGLRRPDTLYPPYDADHLERLLTAIQNSSYDTLKKNCLVYFLLKWHQDGREDKFREEKCIPPQFAALADAYWYLDSGIDETVSLDNTWWFFIERVFREPSLYSPMRALIGTTLPRSYKHSPSPKTPLLSLSSTYARQNHRS
jgi:hypothetical protein